MTLPRPRIRLPTASKLGRIRSLTYARGLPTVCAESGCPNRGECHESGTATFLILGDVCSRNCGFCAVRSGSPEAVNPREPDLVADAARSLGLRHAVVTSVTRDDLVDGGASVFAAVVRILRDRDASLGVETLVPDFQGSLAALECVLCAGPHVMGHNIETVPRLYPTLRPQARYDVSLDLLRRVSETAPHVFTKSSIMVGAGETLEEVAQSIEDLRSVGCDALTIGQYLRPNPTRRPVDRMVPEDEFEELGRVARELGFIHVYAGPLVRSSYRAAEVMESLRASV